MTIRFAALITMLLVPVTTTVPAAAHGVPIVGGSKSSVEIEHSTKLKRILPLTQQFSFNAMGGDSYLRSIIQRYPIDPRTIGGKKAKGSARATAFCSDGVGTINLGNASDRFDGSGNAVLGWNVPGNLNCQFFGLDIGFRGGDRQPGGTSIEVDTTVERLLGDDPDCADPEILCLQGDNRFQVQVDWRDFSGARGSGTGVRDGLEEGTFFFFDPDNTELLLKVLDGCTRNGHYWVFFGATTDVEYTVTVTDTLGNRSRVYENPLGQPAPAIVDTQAFATCP